MPEATVTSKGQITIPAEVRRRLGLKPGDRVDFVPEPTGGFRLQAKKAPLEGLLEMLRGARRGHISVRAMKDAIHEAAVEDWERVQKQDQAG